jgi:enoyl-CoA hydratase
MSAILTERRGNVLLITLNRPERLNAVNSELGVALLAAVEELDADDSLAVGVLTGAGRAFCAGMDLKAFVTEGEPRGITEMLHRESVKPLIVAIEGFAMAAGMEITLSCDLVVASRGAQLGIPEVKVGLFAAGGGVLRLPRKLPYAVAMTMALTGDPITAEEAHRYGLVSHLTEPGEALETALALAETIASRAPLGVIYSKKMVKATIGRTEDEFWDHQAPDFQRVIASADAIEGASAFASKRPPVWLGK